MKGNTPTPLKMMLGSPTQVAEVWLCGVAVFLQGHRCCGWVVSTYGERGECETKMYLVSLHLPCLHTSTQETQTIAPPPLSPAPGWYISHTNNCSSSSSSSLAHEWKTYPISVTSPLLSQHRNEIIAQKWITSLLSQHRKEIITQYQLLPLLFLQLMITNDNFLFSPD